MRGWIVLAVTAVGILLLLAVPVRATILVHRQPGGWGRTSISASWLGLRLLTVRLCHATLLKRWLCRSRRAGQQRSASAASATWRDAGAYIYERLRVRRWRLCVAVGFADAAATAVTAGLLQAAAGLISAWLSRQPPLRQLRPSVLITPDFKRRGVELDLTCILTVAPAHIIAAGAIYGRAAARAWWRLQRQRWQQRGGRQTWPSIPFRA